jgi:hypothetical protein
VAVGDSSGQEEPEKGPPAPKSAVLECAAGGHLHKISLRCLGSVRRDLDLSSWSRDGRWCRRRLDSTNRLSHTV